MYTLIQGDSRHRSVEQEGKEGVDQTVRSGAADEGQERENTAEEMRDERYPSRNRSARKKLGDYVVCSVDNQTDAALDYCYKTGVNVPSMFEQARDSDDCVQWKRAMDDELEALVDSDTFELIHLPEGRKCIGGRWVYAVKQGPVERK